MSTATTAPIITCAGCQSPATSKLACPKCLQSGLNIYFCSQDCFKANYATHKAVHKAAAAAKYVLSRMAVCGRLV